MEVINGVYFDKKNYIICISRKTFFLQINDVSKSEVNFVRPLYTL